MDDSPRETSGYLQNRLRERRAESVVQLRTDSPEQTPSHMQLQSRKVSQNSRAPSVAHTTSTSPSVRGAGAREVEDRLDKLSKENFSLKLDLYHRREKISELEKQVKRMGQVEEDNAELQDLNDNLLAELENRDIELRNREEAVDEAVVMIQSLEDKVKSLEARLHASALLTSQAGGQSPEETDAAATEDPQKELKSNHKKINSRSSIPNDVAGHMAELSSTPAPNPVSRVPSFIQQDTSGTRRLRSIYMDGDKVIRPIPSFASFYSRFDAEDTDDLDDDDDAPGSPGALSAISESELREMYESEVASVEQPTQNQTLPFDDTIDRSRSPTTASTDSHNRRMTRTDRWVEEDAVMSRQRPQTAPRAVSSDAAHVQSRNRVQMEEHATKSKFAQVYRPLPAIPKLDEQEDHTVSPQISQYPLQSQFPPTPDTMHTRPSNKSSASLLDKTTAETDETRPFSEPLNRTADDNVTGFRDSRGLEKEEEFHQTFMSHEYGGFGPRSTDGSARRRGHHTVPHYQQDVPFGGSLYQPDSTSFSNLPFGPFSDPALDINNSATLDLDGSANTAPIDSLDLPPRSSPKPARVFKSRRKSISQLSSPQGSGKDSAQSGGSFYTARDVPSAKNSDAHISPSKSTPSKQSGGGLFRRSSTSNLSFAAHLPAVPRSGLDTSTELPNISETTAKGLGIATPIPLYRKVRLPASASPGPIKRPVTPPVDGSTPTHMLNAGSMTDQVDSTRPPSTRIPRGPGLRTRVSRIGRRNSAAGAPQLNTMNIPHGIKSEGNTPIAGPLVHGVASAGSQASRSGASRRLFAKGNDPSPASTGHTSPRRAVTLNADDYSAQGARAAAFLEAANRAAPYLAGPRAPQ